MPHYSFMLVKIYFLFQNQTAKEESTYLNNSCFIVYSCTLLHFTLDILVSFCFMQCASHSFVSFEPILHRAKDEIQLDPHWNDRYVIGLREDLCFLRIAIESVVFAHRRKEVMNLWAEMSCDKLKKNLFFVDKACNTSKSWKNSLQ